MDFSTRGNFSKRKFQNFTFQINQELILKIFLYILISFILIIALIFFNIYLSYSQRIVNTVNNIPSEITSAILIIDELNIDKIDEFTVILDDLKTMRSENKIGNFKFFIQKREDTFPNILIVEDKFKDITGDKNFEITSKNTKDICGEILESGVNKILVISPQSEIIFNTYACNLSNVYAVGYYPKIKNVNFLTGFLNKFSEIITVTQE